MACSMAARNSSQSSMRVCRSGFAGASGTRKVEFNANDLGYRPPIRVARAEDAGDEFAVSAPRIQDVRCSSGCTLRKELRYHAVDNIRRSRNEAFQ